MDAEIISKENIKPSSPTPSHLKTFNLSVLDQLVISPYVPIILYYNNNGENTSQALEKSLLLKKSLSETLTQFYPLAGTIKNDLSIDCNDVGANFIVTLIHRRLDKFLEHPDHRLINKFLPFEPSFNESSAGNRVTNVQMNVFECGGIAIGLCISHKILDGAALHTFLKAWTNMARGDEEVVYPNLTSPSLFPAKSSWLRDTTMVLNQSFLKEGKGCTKRFVFGSDSITRLRAMAASKDVQKPTRIEVVSGLIWKCAMAASKEAYSGVKKTSTLSHFVNLRSKLASTFSKHFIGNMVWISNAVWNDDETPFHALVNKVRESICKVDVEFVEKAQGDEGYVAMQKSLQEMGEEIGSIGNMNIDNYGFTSWCKMGFYEIDFGWGNPSWVTGLVGDGMPVFMNLVSLMDTKSGDGIEAWVNLDESEMEILQKNQELLSYASLDPSPLLNDESKQLITNKFMDLKMHGNIAQLQTAIAFNV